MIKYKFFPTDCLIDFFLGIGKASMRTTRGGAVVDFYATFFFVPDFLRSSLQG